MVKYFAFRNIFTGFIWEIDKKNNKLQLPTIESIQFSDLVNCQIFELINAFPWV